MGEAPVLSADLLDELSSAVLRVRADGQIDYANRAARELFGRERWPVFAELLDCDAEEANSVLLRLATGAEATHVSWPTVVSCGQVEICEWRLRREADDVALAIIDCVAERAR